MRKKTFLILIISILLITNISLSSKVTSFSLNKKIDNSTADMEKVKLTVISADDIKPGDFMFLYWNIYSFKTNDPGHSRLIIDYNPQENKIKTIETLLDAVTITNVSTYDLVTWLWVFMRVEGATDEQKQNAIDFAKTQLGQPFQYFPTVGARKNYDPTDRSDRYSDDWYCSELLWASYYNCNNKFPEEEPPEGYIYGDGIDIDINGWEKDSDGVASVMPRDIVRNEIVKFTVVKNINISVVAKNRDDEPITDAKIELRNSSDLNDITLSIKTTNEYGECTFSGYEFDLDLFDSYYVTAIHEDYHNQTKKVNRVETGFEKVEFVLSSKARQRSRFMQYFSTSELFNKILKFFKN